MFKGVSTATIWTQQTKQPVVGENNSPLVILYGAWADIAWNARVTASHEAQGEDRTREMLIHFGERHIEQVIVKAQRAVLQQHMKAS